MRQLRRLALGFFVGMGVTVLVTSLALVTGYVAKALAGRLGNGATLVIGLLLFGGICGAIMAHE